MAPRYIVLELDAFYKPTVFLPQFLKCMLNWILVGMLRAASAHFVRISTRLSSSFWDYRMETYSGK